MLKEELFAVGSCTQRFMVHEALKEFDPDIMHNPDDYYYGDVAREMRVHPTVALDSTLLLKLEYSIRAYC